MHWGGQRLCSDLTVSSEETETPENTNQTISEPLKSEHVDTASSSLERLYSQVNLHVRVNALGKMQIYLL